MKSLNKIIKKNLQFLKQKGLTIETLSKDEIRSGKYNCVGMLWEKVK